MSQGAHNLLLYTLHKCLNRRQAIGISLTIQVLFGFVESSRTIMDHLTEAVNGHVQRQSKFEHFDWHAALKLTCILFYVSKNESNMLPRGSY